MPELIWIHFAVPRTSWYEQSEERRHELHRNWDQVRAESRALGATSNGRYHVRGESDYSTVEIWQFADAEAAFEHWQRLTAAGYAQWFRSSNSLGTALTEAS